MVGILLALVVGPSLGEVPPPLTIRIALNEASEVEIGEVVERLSAASTLRVDRPAAPLKLPLTGLAGPLTRAMLGDTLGPDAGVEVRPGELVVTIDPAALGPDRKPAWEKRVRDLSDRATREVARRLRYGMRTRPSYRPNDPARPTVCLIHGLNSSSGVFVHMVGPLEAAGHGIVLYDFPYNRDLDQTSAAFGRDWLDFRRKVGETRPWSIVAHSMGSLLARSHVEGGAGDAGDVDALILIAPPNHGSSLSRGQTLLQMVQGVQALNGTRRTDPLAVLGDGLGEAADDMTPGSDYLRRLNARPRRAGVRYRTLAGDSGYLSSQGRRQVESRLRFAGVVGEIGRAVASGASPQLDEITDGLGDGCVSVASTRLEGVSEHRTIHANHLELIRAPLLFPEAGPVASMPDILRWLDEGRAGQAPKR